MTGRAGVGGWVDSRYAPACEVFTEQVAVGRETGAAVAVVQNGQVVLDLYGGWQDVARRTVWSPRTLAPLFCVGKPVAALALLVLVSRGVLDLDDQVAGYWPRFGAAGKDQVTVRHLLSHTAGLPAFPLPRPARSIPQWQLLAGDLAGAPLTFAPGTAVAEHALTFGHLVGELVRQADGRPLGVFVREEIARPWGLDLAVGLTRAQQGRAAEVEFADPGWLADTLGLPFTLRHRALDSPTGCWDPRVLNTSWCRGALLPAVNVHGTARSVAQLFAAVLAGGGHGGRRLLDAGLTASVGAVQVEGYDLVLDRPVCRGLGVLVEEGDRWGVAAFGGNLLAVDPAAQRVFVYLTRSVGDGTAAARMLGAVRSTG